MTTETRPKVGDYVSATYWGTEVRGKVVKTYVTCGQRGYRDIVVIRALGSDVHVSVRAERVIVRKSLDARIKRFAARTPTVNLLPTGGSP